MRVLDGFGRLDHQGHGGPEIVPERGELLGEVAPLDELHAEIALVVVLADLVNRHDAGVVQQRDGLGFILEPAQLGVVGQESGLDHLEGDGPIEADLPGLVDDAHAAAAQLFQDLVVAEVADGGAARQVTGGPVAVAREGRVAGVGCPVAGGVVGGRSRSVGLRPGRLDVVRRRDGRMAWAGGKGVDRTGDVGRDERIALPSLAHQAGGAEALRGVRRSFGAATRATVRAGGHGTPPSGASSSRLDRPRCRISGGVQRRVRGIVARRCGPWIADGPPIFPGRVLSQDRGASHHGRMLETRNWPTAWPSMMTGTESPIR